jgi:hypothetical protein
MELGGMTQFTFIPKCRGNRELSESERVSVKVNRLTAIDVLQDLTPEQLFAWRDKAFHRWAKTEKDGDGERIVGFEGIADGLDLVPSSMLSIIRRVITHTHGYQNITVDGNPCTDAAEIFLRTRIPDSLDQTDNLLVELYNALRDTASMTDDELKNWSMPSTGGTTQQSTNATDVEGGASQPSAGEREGQDEN